MQWGVALLNETIIWHYGGPVPHLAVRKGPSSVTIGLMTVGNGLSDWRDCCGIEEEETQDEDCRDLKKPQPSQVCQTEQNSCLGMVEPGAAQLGSGLM